MTKITFNQEEGGSETVEVATGTSVMRAAVENSIAGIIGECGGQAMCATCHVYVPESLDSQLTEVGDDEDEMLDCVLGERTDRSRLGCQVVVTPSMGDFGVTVPKGGFA